jgi:hypothetical protein
MFLTRSHGCSTHLRTCWLIAYPFVLAILAGTALLRPFVLRAMCGTATDTGSLQQRQCTFTLAVAIRVAHVHADHQAGRTTYGPRTAASHEYADTFIDIEGAPPR